MIRKLLVASLLILLCGFSSAYNAYAGKIVVANDEWTLSNSGWSSPNDPGVFATNTASWFTGGSAGSFLAYSSNFGLTQSSLQSAMTTAGHTWLVSTGISFTLDNLLVYDGVFLGGNAADNDVLISYVNAGGNVYLMGGTGGGGSASEAARWNTFLNHFGLGFASSSYNGIGGDIAISNSHPIFAGVDHLHQDNGSSVLLFGANPNAEILISYEGKGLYAVYNQVPAPAALILLGSGLVSLAAARWRCRRSNAKVRWLSY